MNTIGIALTWCAVQVTLIGLLASGLYILLRRMRPAAAEPVVLTGLLMVVILSLLALSPWPRWSIHRFYTSAQSAVAPANSPSAPTDDSAQKMSHNSAGQLAGDSIANSPLPLKEGPGVRETRSSGAVFFWQALDEEPSQPQGAESAKAWRWPAVVAMIVLSAMICGLGWLVLGVMAVRRQLLRSRPVLDGKLLELVDMLRAKLGCRRLVEVRHCDDLVTAATVGWLSPVILLPFDWETWTGDQRHAVLAHEIAHARSQDFLALLCGQFGLMLHFYHPLVHWLMNRLRLEQELAADAAAAGVSGGQRQYLTTIAELALRKQERPLLWPARTFLPTQNTFLRRIAMLRDSKFRIDQLSPFVRLATIGSVLLCGLFVAGVRGPGNSRSALAEDQSSKVTQDESKKTFEARLPSGITVELLGVSENPSKDRPWWRPDGSPLADRPYDSLKGDVTIHQPYRDQPHVVREFAVLLHNMPSESVGTQIEFEPKRHSIEREYPKLLDNYTGDLHAAAVIFLDRPAAGIVRFGVANGPWGTTAERNQGDTGLHMYPIDRGVVFSEPVEKADKTVVATVAYGKVDGEKRIVAVDDKGKEYTASSMHDGFVGDIVQMTATFSNLPLEQIKQFRFQSRPYKWVEFRNVSLQPGQKTDVQVVLSDKAAPVEKRGATSAQSQVEPKGPVLIYEIDPKSAPGGFPGADMDKILNVIERRINTGAKKIARVRLVEHLNIEIAVLNSSAAEANRVIRLLERPGTLEFRILANEHDNKLLIERALKEPDNKEIKDSEGNREAWWVYIAEGRERDFNIPSIAKRERAVGDNKVTEILVVQDKYNMTGDLLNKVNVGTDQSGRPDVEFALNPQGGKLFGALTGENTPDEKTGFSRRLGIILDGKLYSAPSLMSTILDHGVIQGSFTKQEVTDLADALNSGSLPVRLKLVRIQSAESGEDKPAAGDQQSLQPQQERIYPPNIDAAAAGKKALEKYDANKDGKISGAELDKVPALKAAMGMMHTNKDKGITADEIAAHIKAWQATKIARIGGIPCKITRDGKPVEGAEVKFVPEDFLGKEFITAAGTTDKDGLAMMSIPFGPNDPKGVAPGFYSVEITKPGEDIPAKYNTQTIYGLEIAPDVRISQAPDFDISSDQAEGATTTNKSAIKEQQSQPRRFYLHEIDADAAGQEAIKLYDANHDGKISGAELDKVPSLASAQAMANFKSTKEKGVTAADITARIKAWQQTKVARIGGVIAQVTRNGKPLAGAEVKFVPEKFMGNLPECTGTNPTGPDGSVEITEPVNPGDPKGVPPGYYRVEITMPDGSIPAKYNTQTIFGEEVCPDVRRMSGYQYDIK